MFYSPRIPVGSGQSKLTMRNSLLEKTLQQAGMSLKLLKVLMENSFDSILVTDTTVSGKIIYANKVFKKLTGYDPSEVIGKTPRILQGIGTDKKVIAQLARCLESNGRFEGRAINYRKDATPFIMHWRVLPVKVGKRPMYGSRFNVKAREYSSRAPAKVPELNGLHGSVWINAI